MNHDWFSDNTYYLNRITESTFELYGFNNYLHILGFNNYVRTFLCVDFIVTNHFVVFLVIQ